MKMTSANKLSSSIHNMPMLDESALFSFVFSNPTITDKRKLHMKGVACAMKQLAISYGWNSEAVEDAETLGLLHDIGYAFVDVDPRRHEESGGEFLQANGYKHWQEVRWHGLIAEERPYDSQLLLMLNYCDMTTGPGGETMTMDERVQDIANRYGSDSPITLRAMQMQKEIASALH